MIDARCALETLRCGIEEWGTLTVSEPIVILDTGQFKLPGSFEDTSPYITRARNQVQGNSSQSSQSSVGNSLNIQVAPTYSLNSVGKKTPIDTGDSLTPSKAADTQDAAATPAPLPTPPAPSFSSFSTPDSIAVPTGESAKITEMLGRALANPTQSRFTNPDVTVHFAIVQVSCNPGWRTRENYIGDVTATCEFYDSEHRTFQREDDPVRPLVFSVLPLLDAQTLELANNDQRVTNLVAQIAAAYPTTVANFRASDLIKLTKQYQSSVATRSPRTVTNSYSAGSTFGFRFSPSLTALKNPADRKSGAANILQATSFPVLVTFIINQPHAAKFDSVLVHLAHHWFINDRPPLRTFWQRWATPLKRDRIDDNFELADAAEHAREAVYRLPEIRDGNIGLDTPATIQMLYRQYLELRVKATGSSHPVFSFPVAASVRQARGENLIISDVTPSTITKDLPVAMLIQGFNFFGGANQFEVWLGQQKGEVQSLRHTKRQGDQLFVKFSATPPGSAVPAGGMLPLIVIGPNGMAAKPDAIEIIASAASKDGKPDPTETHGTASTTGTTSSTTGAASTTTGAASTTTGAASTTTAPTTPTAPTGNATGTTPTGSTGSLPAERPSQDSLFLPDPPPAHPPDPAAVPDPLPTRTRHPGHVPTPSPTRSPGSSPVTEQSVTPPANPLLLFASSEKTPDYDWDPTLPPLGLASASVPITAQLEDGRSDLPVP